MLPKRSVGAELGVARGDFSKCILLDAQPRVLHLVDAWRQQTSGTVMDCLRSDEVHDKRYRETLAKIAKWKGDTVVKVHRMQTVDAAKRLQDGELDWVYIDADHSFDGVYGDLNAWWPKVRAGGVISGHDFLPTYHGQRAGIRDLDRMKAMEDDGTGVIGAVMTFMREMSLDQNRIGVTDERTPSFWFRKP